ncbi:MAG: hypothetical protein LBU32_01335 [Clostridiales bacterium]|nr:hypothetical protein [Clostridiales bacterium]
MARVQQKCSVSTRNQRKTAISSFAKHCAKKCRLETAPFIISMGASHPPPPPRASPPSASPPMIWSFCSACRAGLQKSEERI